MIFISLSKLKVNHLIYWELLEQGSIATSTTSKAMVKSLAAIEENLKKLNAKQVVRKLGNAKSASNVQGNRSVRSRLSDEVERGLVAFTADYHRPMHHPPKNN